MEFQSSIADSEYYCSGAWRTRFEGNLDREGSPSINLGLGIGAGLGGAINKGRPIFTAQQLHELNHQVLIFNYIIAGLSVPVHLIVPIWKSVSCSLGSGNLGIYRQYPSSLGFSRQGFNQHTAMDPQPGRCRRTDGKKWRCSKNAIDDQKYCERHMHRGHQRSRKHVEASQNVSLSHKTTETTNTKSNDSSSKRADVNVGTEIHAKTTSATLHGGSMEYITGKNNTDCIEKKDDGFTKSSYNGGKSKFARVLAPGFGSSPISILQGGTGVSGSIPGSESTTLVDTELKRCRRTDGKKWRCSHEVMAEQKYCARHIHRGVKKTKIPSETVTVAAPPPPPPPPLAIPQKGTINLNTTLSINEGDYTSSSEATTITDENTSFTRIPVLFPE